MKHSVKWYEECLLRSNEFVKHEERELKIYIKNKIEHINRIKRANEEREFQIIKAKDKGIKEFDSEKFGKTRKKVSPVQPTTAAIQNHSGT